MIPAPIPADDAQRVLAMRSLALLDTPKEDRFDRIARLASRLFDVPIALISLIDRERQWFKSAVGLPHGECNRTESFCGHLVATGQALVVPDALLDERFHDNPLLLSLRSRFYAGVPLKLNGWTVGTLCLIDRRPRDFDDQDLALLQDLGQLAEGELQRQQSWTLDADTGLFSRAGFLQIGRHLLPMCRRLDAPVSLLSFELDALPPRQEAGAAADRRILAFSSLLQQLFADKGVVATLSAGRFSVLLGGVPARDIDNALDHLLMQSRGRAGADIGYTVSCRSIEADADLLEPALAKAAEDLRAARDAKRRGRSEAIDALAA